MERQATQPAAVPSGRKRRRVSKKRKQEEEAQAQALDKQAIQPPTSELVIALNALPKAADLTPLPTPSPTDQSVNELMEGTLKEYEEECVEEGTFQSDPATEGGNGKSWTRWTPSSTNSCMKHARFIPIDSLNVSTPNPILVP